MKKIKELLIFIAAFFIIIFIFSAFFLLNVQNDAYYSGIQSLKIIIENEYFLSALFYTLAIPFLISFIISAVGIFTLNIKEDVGTIQLFGTKAGAILDPELEIFTENNNYLTNLTFKESTALSFGGLFESEIKHFIDCLVDGEKCISPAEDGVVLMRILDAAYKSAATGHEVIIE